MIIVLIVIYWNPRMGLLESYENKQIADLFSYT